MMHCTGLLGALRVCDPTVQFHFPPRPPKNQYKILRILYCFYPILNGHVLGGEGKLKTVGSRRARRAHAQRARSCDRAPLAQTRAPIGLT